MGRRAATVPLLWVTGTGVCRASPRGRPSGGCWHARGRAPHTVLDLDYRPMFWPDVETARRPRSAGCSTTSRSPSATGPRSRSRSAPPTRDEAAAPAAGPRRRLALVKKGADGVLVATAGRSWTVVPPRRSRSCAGSAPVTRSAARSCHGLLAGWDAGADRRATPTRRARSWRRRLACADAMPTRPRSRSCCEPRVPLADETFAELLDVRVRHPERDRRAPARRGRGGRSLLPARARCSWSPPTIPARGALGVGDDPLAMADRRSLLDRLLIALADPRVDGVLGSAGRDRGPAAARRCSTTGRHRLDEPRRAGRRGLGDRRPVHRLRRRAPSRAPGFDGGKMLLRLDHARPRHDPDARGLRAGRDRARRPRPDGDGRAAAVHA